MAKHIHIHVHRPARTRDAVKPDPAREALVVALMEAIRAREGKTQDADFKEEEHPRDHGKFTSGGGSGPSGPKPTSATAKGSKAAVHELLSSGHRFSVDELMKATGCSNKSTLMTALADLKNPKYAGKLGALKIEKHADGGYHVVKNTDKQELPVHPDLAAVTRPGAPIPGSGQKSTKAEEEDMATRVGEPRPGAAPGRPEDSPESRPPPSKSSSKGGPALYHGGTFSGGKVDGVLYLTPQKSAAESYAGATTQRNKVTGAPEKASVSQFKLPDNAKLGTAADVERVAKRLGYNVGPYMAKGQLTAPYLLDKNWMGEQDLKKLTTALLEEGFHGASFQDHDEDHRPHDATAYWGKGDVVPHTESPPSAPPNQSRAALRFQRDVDTYSGPSSAVLRNRLEVAEARRQASGSRIASEAEVKLRHTLSVAQEAERAAAKKK